MHAYNTPLEWQLINVYVNITFHFPIIILVLLSACLSLPSRSIHFLGVPSSFSPQPLDLHLALWLLCWRQSLAGAKLNGFCPSHQYWSVWILIRCVVACHWLQNRPMRAELERAPASNLREGIEGDASLPVIPSFFSAQYYRSFELQTISKWSL